MSFIDTPTDFVDKSDDLAGTGGPTNTMVPEADPPAGGMIPFKGLEPVPEASPSGINVVTPTIKGAGGA